MRIFIPIPVIVGVLIASGIAGALARLAGWRRKRPEPAGDGADAPTSLTLVRLSMLIDLAWAAYFLLHFVLLAALSDSREVAPWLMHVATVAAAVTLAGAAVSLRGLIRSAWMSSRR